MKIELWVIGKTNFKYLEEGISLYQKRLCHYLKFSIETIPNIKNAKNLKPAQIIDKEGLMVLSKINSDDYLVLLDEAGKSFTSIEFAKKIENYQRNNHRRILFLVGGAYGFSTKIKQRADEQISLSKMTFSHQMVRLFFVEQLYRAMTIIRHEPYHNQ